MSVRIRTIPQCLQEIKLVDKDTGITENFIRQLCKKNCIKYFKSGSKYLVNYDDLLFYLDSNNEVDTKCS